MATRPTPAMALSFMPVKLLVAVFLLFTYISTYQIIS